MTEDCRVAQLVFKRLGLDMEAAGAEPSLLALGLAVPDCDEEGLAPA